MRIANAKPEDAEVLSVIAFEAKKSWRYPDRWLAAWRRELTISPDYIRAHPAFVAVEDDRIVGFAAAEIFGRVATLAHLWVRPEEMRRGIGRALFSRCEEAARAAGADRIEVESDPHAEHFYIRLGAERIGERPADMEGVKRSLPILRKALKQKQGQPASRGNLGNAPRNLRAFTVCGRHLRGASLESFGKA